jgi:hypothetical protein
MPAELPPLPEGFTLDQQSLPPLPEGFTLDSPQAQAQQPTEQQFDPMRATALAGRAVGEGVGSALMAPVDLAVATSQHSNLVPAQQVFRILQQTTGKTPSQLVALALNKTFGTNLPESESFSGLLSDSLTEAGAPVPATSGEQLGSAAIRGTAAGVTGGAAFGAAGANAVRAGVSGATSGASAEGARQLGFGKVGQFIAGVAGGMAPSVIENTARLAGTTAANVVRPMTRSGQEKIAGQIMQEQADDATAAAQNLAKAQEVVPGSARTSGEASQDVGLMALEKAVRGRNPSEFGQRLSEQNVARQEALSKLAGSADDMAAAKQARSDVTTPMREQALSAATQADSAPIVAKIDEILASPAGKRQTVSSTMQWAKSLIGEEKDAAALYEIRKDLQLAQRGKLQPSSQNAPNASTLAQARGELGDVVKVLDDAIESAAPGFKAYLARYAEMSKPIDQARVLQEIQRRSQLTTADVTTGQQFLGPASFSRAVDSAMQKNAQTLTKQQVEQLNAIRTDLQYGQAINSSLIKAPGSDTFQNLSIAQAIGATGSGGHPAITLLTKPLNWVYKLAGTDQGISEILTKAMLDPKLASDMLKRATPANVGQFSARLRAAVAGTTAATVARPSKPSAAENIQPPEAE